MSPLYPPMHSLFNMVKSILPYTSTLIFSRSGLLLTLILLSLLTSCIPNRDLVYFNKKVAEDTKYIATLSSSNPAPVRIQTDDVLAIVVSSMSDETNALFNTLNNNSITTLRFSTNGGGGNQPLGYLVDRVGEVNLPIIGKTKLAGLTLDEADAYLRSLLNQYVKSPTVNVRILNHKFTVIGEVVRPGLYNLSDNPTNLSEVIGLAGDLTIYGRRDNIKLIRTINNKREIIQLDLTSQQVINSPYYFLENNDVVYVEARSTKVFSTERSVLLLPVVFGIASISILLANLLR